MKCIYCKELIIRRDLKDHIDKCKISEKECGKCNKKYTLEEEMWHLSCNCNEIIVECRHNVTIGCTFKCKKKDIHVHEQDGKLHYDMATQLYFIDSSNYTSHRQKRKLHETDIENRTVIINNNDDNSDSD